MMNSLLKQSIPVYSHSLDQRYGSWASPPGQRLAHLPLHSGNGYPAWPQSDVYRKQDGIIPLPPVAR